MSDLLFLSASITVVLFASYLLAKIQHGRSSDNAVHLFFIHNIRNSGHKLPVRVDRLLNPSYCGYPLFLHWCFSFFSDRFIAVMVPLMNPLLNTLLVLLTYVFLKLFAPANFPVGWAVLLLSLTPQFYHTNNARNMGLSARAIGIVLFYLFMQLALAGKSTSYEWAGCAGAVFAGYLILGFNKFAIQASLLCGLVMLLIFQQWIFFVLLLVSLILFISLHPRYGSAFLLHYARYSNLYRKERAHKTILDERYSIWRDLIYDIPKSIKESGALGVYYAYKNTFIIIIFLNPLVILTVWGWITQPESSLWLSYQSMIALSGLIVCFLISFRPTRFLGQPERYVEIITPFATVAGVSYLSELGQQYLHIALVWYVVLVSLQLVLAKVIARKFGKSMVSAIEVITNNINERSAGEPVRFASNNEELLRLFLNQPWQFSLYWSPEKNYGGYPYKEAFSSYSCLNRNAFENIVKEYRINFCLLDKRVFEDCFTDNLDEHKRLEVIFENENLKLLYVYW